MVIPEASDKNQPRWRKWAVAPAVIALLLGVLPILGEKINYHYMASPAWVSAVWPFAWLIGAFCAGSFVWGTANGLATSHKPPSPLKAVLIVLSAPLLGFWTGSISTTMSLPMIWATVAGEDTTVQFAVLDANGGGSRGCRNPIRVADAPFGFDKICGFSDEFRDGLTAGSKIAVVGRGTSLGVFPQQAYVVE